MISTNIATGVFYVDYIRTRLTPTIIIKKLITLYYYEFGKGYVFRGEKHDFWEILYVDKGEIEVLADTDRYSLKQGSIIFHKPNEFHSFHAGKGTAPSVIVMTFDCSSRAMKRFENQVISLQDDERNLLAELIEEAMEAFEFPFIYPLSRKKQAPPGSEQLVQNYLTTFLIRLLRRNEFRSFKKTAHQHELSSTAKEKSSHLLAQKVLDYLESHQQENVTLEQLSESLHIAKTRLKDQFKKETGSTIMDTFSKMRLNRAKQLIREDNSNFTEISRQLGYNSIHYFSKAFKKATGATPSEYARTVKARVKAAEEARKP
jgi:AraC-like DNA-binding protein